jgi:hypothetical protein
MRSEQQPISSQQHLAIEHARERLPIPAARAPLAMVGDMPLAIRHSLVALTVGILATLLALLALAQPWQTRIDIGGLFDSPYLRNFHAAEYSSEHQSTFRWSRPEASLVLPGAGRVAPLTLAVHGDYPDMPLTLDAGTGAQQIDLRPGWQRIMLLPRAERWSGDVHVHLSAPPQASAADPRERGIALSRLAIDAPGGTPPAGQALLIGLYTLLATLLAAWSFKRLWVGILAGVVLAVGSALVLALDDGSARLMLTDYTGRLVLVLLAGGALALVLARLLRLLAVRGILRLTTGAQRALAGVALLTFLLRFGGLAYPLNHNSDIPYILGRTWMVREGQLLTLFLPNPELTPVQWEEGITIPRSPFYYILTTPVTLLPNEGTGDKLGMMAFSSAIDALGVMLIAMLAFAASGSQRAALMAAFLAGMLPVGIMFIVSWGILPTLLGQFLALLSVVLWLYLRPRLRERWAWLLLVVCLSITFLSYPTALLFLGVTGCILLALLALQRDPATLPTLWAALVALVVAFVLYYGWHVPAMVSNTLPTLLGDLPGEAAAGEMFTWKRTWDALTLQLVDKYGVLVLLLAAGGALLLALRRVGERAHYARLVLFAWGAAFIPLALGDEYVVLFILKHVLHILPVLAIFGGLLLGWLARWRAGAVVAYAILALVFWQGLVLELDVIVNAFVQLK